jgi:Regulator of ribonuclease activity B
MLRLVLLSAILAAALVLDAARRRTRGMTRTRINKDTMTLRQLALAGSDLARPHGAEFFIYLPTEQAARALATRFASEGFSYSLHSDPQGLDWICVLRKSMVLTPDALTRLRGQLTEIAAAYGGSYDGWGAEVEA